MEKIPRFLLVFCICVLCAAFATGPIFAQSARVGVILPLTGKLAKLAQIEYNSFFMAMDEINAAGGFNGKNIELIIEDTTGRPDMGRSAIEKLISEDNVVIVGGGFSSSVTWAAASVAQERKVPFLINTASADKISEQGWEYIFRLNPPASEYSKPLTSFFTDVVRPRTVTVFYEKTPFGQYGLKKFLELRKRLALKALSRQGYEPDTVDFVPLLVKAAAKKPDLVYMISSLGDTASLLQFAKKMNLNPKLFVGFGSSFTVPEFRESAGDTSEYVVSATPWTPSLPYPGAKEYYEKFLAKYNSPAEYHGAQAYAAMYVIADALKRALSLTPDDVRDALAETDMMTAYGPVKFVSDTKKTQQNSLSTLLVQWISGTLEIVWPKELATAKYVYPVPKWNER